MRVLLDENIDHSLKPLFGDEVEVLTVRECGWQGKSNGELLHAAQSQFDVFITMDKNLEHQQNLHALKLAVLVLRASSNAYSLVAPLMPKVKKALRSIKPGQVVHVMP